MFYVQKMLLFHQNQTIQFIRNDREEVLLPNNNQTIDKTGQYPFVASKRGVYYYPINCPKAQGLSSKNTLYFKDKIAAEDAGYKPNSSCF